MSHQSDILDKLSQQLADQTEYIKQLQQDLKDAIAAYRHLMLSQEQKK